MLLWGSWGSYGLKPIGKTVINSFLLCNEGTEKAHGSKCLSRVSAPSSAPAWLLQRSKPGAKSTFSLPQINARPEEMVDFFSHTVEFC